MLHRHDTGGWFGWFDAIREEVGDAIGTIPARPARPTRADVPARRHNASDHPCRSREAGVVNAGRDRDDAGRPRQARPRDELGRPLPYGAVGVPPVSEEPLPPELTVEVARELVQAGQPFAAHETFEVAWRHRPEDERELWQGMAQVCAGLTHAARGNAAGASRLVDRGAARLATYAATGGPTYGLDLDEVVSRARACADLAGGTAR